MIIDATDTATTDPAQLANISPTATHDAPPQWLIDMVAAARATQPNRAARRRAQFGPRHRGKA